MPAARESRVEHERVGEAKPCLDSLLRYGKERRLSRIAGWRTSESSRLSSEGRLRDANQSKIGSGEILNAVKYAPPLLWDSRRQRRNSPNGSSAKFTSFKLMRRQMTCTSLNVGLGSSQSGSRIMDPDIPRLYGLSAVRYHLIKIEACPRYWRRRWKRSSLCTRMSRTRLRPRFWPRSPMKTPGNSDSARGDAKRYSLLANGRPEQIQEARP